MLSRLACPLILLAAFMLAGCGGAADDGGSPAADEISTPFTDMILANLKSSDDDVTRGLSEAHQRHFEHLGHLAFEEGCMKCHSCGYSACG